jgi:hypothetical protein
MMVPMTKGIQSSSKGLEGNEYKEESCIKELSHYNSRVFFMTKKHYLPIT